MAICLRQPPPPRSVVLRSISDYPKRLTCTVQRPFAAALAIDPFVGQVFGQPGAVGQLTLKKGYPRLKPVRGAGEVR